MRWAEPMTDPSLLTDSKTRSQSRLWLSMSSGRPSTLASLASEQLSWKDPALRLAITPLFWPPYPARPWLEGNHCCCSFERWSPNSSCLQMSSILRCWSAGVLGPFDFLEAEPSFSAQDGGPLCSLSSKLSPLSLCILSSFKNKLCV